MATNGSRGTRSLDSAPFVKAPQASKKSNGNCSQTNGLFGAVSKYPTTASDRAPPMMTDQMNTCDKFPGIRTLLAGLVEHADHHVMAASLEETLGLGLSSSQYRIPASRPEPQK